MIFFPLMIAILSQYVIIQAEQHDNEKHQMPEDPVFFKHHSYIVLYTGENKKTNVIKCKMGEPINPGQHQQEHDEKSTEGPEDVVKGKWSIPRGVQIYKTRGKNNRKDGHVIDNDEKHRLRNQHEVTLPQESKQPRDGNVEQKRSKDSSRSDKSVHTSSDSSHQRDENHHHRGEKHHKADKSMTKKPWIELTPHDELLFHNPDQSVEGTYVCTYSHEDDTQLVSQTIIRVHVFDRSSLDVGERLKVAFIAAFIFMVFIGIFYGGYVCYRRKQAPKYFMAQNYADPADIVTLNETDRGYNSNK